MRRHSSFIAKGHVHVGYSVASVLITPLAHYQPFAKWRLRRKYLYGSPYFYIKNTASLYRLPLLFPEKRGQSLRFSGAMPPLCGFFHPFFYAEKRSLAGALSGGSLSLSPFCEMRLRCKFVAETIGKLSAV